MSKNISQLAGGVGINESIRKLIEEAERLRTSCRTSRSVGMLPADTKHLVEPVLRDLSSKNPPVI